MFFSVIKSFILNLVISTIIFIILFQVMQLQIILQYLFLIYLVIVLIIKYNCYKLVICQNSIKFYKLLEKNKTIILNEINSIKIEKVRTNFYSIGNVRNMNIKLNDNSIYDFNINQFNNDLLLSKIKEICQDRNIQLSIE